MREAEEEKVEVDKGQRMRNFLVGGVGAIFAVLVFPGYVVRV
jgi:hypothetical protein